MNSLKITLFIVAMTIVSSMVIYNIYQLWIEPTESVIDKYNKLETELNSAESLDELVQKYEDILKEVETYEANPENSKVDDYGYSSQEPYKSKNLIEAKIKDWEMKNSEIYKIIFYCLIGTVFIVLGFIIYLKNYKWLGLTFLIIGFTELIYWGTPSYMSQPIIYHKMVLTQLLVNILSFVFLLVVGWYLNIIKPGQSEN